jgi:hypothetical protein
MSNDIVKGNEPAFPSEDNTRYYHGLTKREYMATQLMSGYISEGYPMGEASKLAVQASDLLLIKLNEEQ